VKSVDNSVTIIDDKKDIVHK